MAGVIKVDEIEKSSDTGTGIKLNSPLLNSTGTEIIDSDGGITIPSGKSIRSSSGVDVITSSGELNATNFVGMIAPFAMSSAPTGWLVCNGAEYAIADYGDLYTAIGTTWGALTNGSGGAGSTHFVVPDLRGAFLRGTGTGTLNSNNKVGPTNVGDFQEDAVLDHRHSLGGANGIDPSLRLSTTSASYPFITYLQGVYQRQIGTTSIAASNLSNFLNSDYRTDSDQNIVYNAGIQYCIRY